MNKSATIAIIGGGIGGLVTAIALRKKGFSPVVYEQAPEIKPVGAGILLSINSMSALANIGVADTVIKNGCSIYSFAIQNTSGGNLSTTHFESLSRKFGFHSVGIARSVLHDVLIKSLPSEYIRLGHEFDSVSQREGKAQIIFKNKKAIEADIVIGTDGLRSRVRQSVLGDFSLRYSGQTGWRGLAELPNIKLDGFFETWGIGNRFGIVPVSENHVYWYAGINAPAKSIEKNGEKAKTRLLKLFGDWHTPIKKVIELTDPNGIIQADIFDSEPAERWFNGSVVMLGDAIHSTTPNLGQGAGIAIESALVLAQCIEKNHDLQDAFASYQSLRKKRTAWVTHQSHMFGKLAQMESPIICRIRNFLLKTSTLIVPQLIQERSAQKLLGYSVDFS